MTETKSKSPKSSARQRKDAMMEVEANIIAREHASVATVDEKKKESKTTMSDAPSILSYAEDITDAPPPVPLPVGDYPAEIRGATIKTSQKGNRYVDVQFFVAPEAYPADYTDGNENGEMLNYRRLTYEDTPRGRHRMDKFCKAIGAKTGRDIDVNEWVGLSATIAITEEEFEGEPRAVISKVTAS